MRKPMLTYTVVTRTPDGTEAARTGLRAVNADIAIRQAKRERASRDGIALRAIVALSAVPTETLPDATED